MNARQPYERGAAPEEQAKKARRYELQTAAEVAAASTPPWRIKGVLLQEGIAAIFGPSSSGKSFLGLDVSFAIVEGRVWFGYRVEHCNVLYISLEGQAGQRNRIKAYIERRGDIGAKLLRFITAPFSLLLSDDVEALIATIAETGIKGVIVIDTLNAATLGLDENSAEDMGKAIEAVRRIQEAFGGLVILIHHSGKDVTRGMRGHSSLPAALDTIIEVNRTGDGRAWHLAKSRDGADGDKHAFRLEIVDLGADDAGDPVTSCVVAPELGAPERSRPPAAPAGGNQTIVWEALGELFRKSPDRGRGGAAPHLPCLNLDAAVRAVQDRLPCEAKRRPERTRKAIEGLISRRLLTLTEEWLWCT